jgi:hypothetical protein
MTGALAIIVGACGGQEPPPKAPAPTPPPKDPLVLTQATQACARLSACTRGGDAKVRDPSACVDWWVADADAKTPDPLRKCLADASGCEQVLGCMRGGGDARAAAFCGKSQGVVSGCDGDRLVSCGDEDAHESNVMDCAAMGASCREVKASGGIVLRACWSPTKCPAGAPDLRCDGPGAVVSCRDGAFERITCRPGTTCEEHKDEAGDVIAACELPHRRRCDMRGLRHCEEDRLVECDRAGGKVHVTDCVGLGLHCAGVGPRARCVVPTNIECDKEFVAKCEGNALVFCAAGRLAKVSCASIGFGTCDPAAKGPFAACAPKIAPAAPAASPTPATPVAPTK